MCFFSSPHFILIHLFVRHWSNSECWANNRFHVARLFELFQMETSAKRKRNRDTTKPNTSESEATALPQRHIPCIEKKPTPELAMCLSNRDSCASAVLPGIWYAYDINGQHRQPGIQMRDSHYLLCEAWHNEANPKLKRFQCGSRNQHVRSCFFFSKMIKRHFHNFFPLLTLLKTHMCTAMWSNGCFCY